MVALRQEPTLADGIIRLADELEALDLRAAPLAAHGVDDERQRLVRVLRSYLAPRLVIPDQPLVVVVAGPTGSGKSTLVNSLTARTLSPVGVLRPTTTEPIALAHGLHSARYWELGGAECRVATGEAPILEHVTFVDTPDIDSTSVGHRARAEAIVDEADAVILVVSASRYADLAPWELMRRAASRSTPIVPVLNRVTSGSAGAAPDFSRRLSAEGLAGPILVIDEYPRLESGRLPRAAVRPLARLLVDMSLTGSEGRDRLARRVLEATLAQVRDLREEIDAGRRRLRSLMEKTVLEHERWRDHWEPPDLTYPVSRRMRRGRWLRLATEALALSVEQGLGSIERASLGDLAQSQPLSDGGRRALSRWLRARAGGPGRSPEQMAETMRAAGEGRPSAGLGELLDRLFSERGAAVARRLRAEWGPDGPVPLDEEVEEVFLKAAFVDA